MNHRNKLKNIEQANLMLEQSYLKSKSLLKEETSLEKKWQEHGWDTTKSPNKQLELFPKISDEEQIKQSVLDWLVNNREAKCYEALRKFDNINCKTFSKIKNEFRSRPKTK